MTLKDLRTKCPPLPIRTTTNSTKSQLAGFLLLSLYVPDGGYQHAIYQTFPPIIPAAIAACGIVSGCFSYHKSVDETQTPARG